MDDRPIHYDLDAGELAPVDEPVIEAVATEEPPKGKRRSRSAHVAAEHYVEDEAEREPVEHDEEPVPEEVPPPEAS
jgi:hypothetical protein